MYAPLHEEVLRRGLVDDVAAVLRDRSARCLPEEHSDFGPLASPHADGEPTG